MSDEEAFLARIRAFPTDEISRLVYADWMEESRDPDSSAKAEYLRLESELNANQPEGPDRERMVGRLRVLAKQLNESWKAAIARVPLEQCGMQWQFECPQTWNRLEETEQHWVRRCSVCERPVYYCSTIDEAKRWSAMGRCISIEVKVARKPADLVVPPRDRSANEIDLDECDVLGMLSSLDEETDEA